MAVLLWRSPAGVQVLATWAWWVVPTGLSVIRKDTSIHIRLFVFSDDIPGSNISESTAVGLSDELGWSGATDPGSTALYFTPSSDGPSCGLPTAACLSVIDGIAGRGADQAPDAGRLLAVSIEPPELASSLDLCLTVWWLYGCRDALSPISSAVLRFPADTTVFLFFCLRDDRAILSSLRTAGESCNVEIALIKAKGGVTIESKLSRVLSRASSEEV